MTIGGHQVPGEGTGDDGFDEEGYDESQRAEILEATRDGPTDGTILTDLDPDLATSDEEDELEMTGDEVGDDAEDDEDDLQDSLDTDDDTDDDDPSDGDDKALRP